MAARLRDFVTKVFPRSGAELASDSAALRSRNLGDVGTLADLMTDGT